MNLAATLPWEAVGARTWDAVVVGAGPAGALAARQLARRGLAVLLVDKSAFPRWKVCGCCLNGSALATLRAVGLGDLTRRLHAVPLTTTRIAVNGGQASVRLPMGSALSRTEFDAALVQTAIEAGVDFLPETSARISATAGDRRTLRLVRGDHEARGAARVVLAAVGLGGREIHQESAARRQTDKDSRIGMGAVANSAPAFYQRGTIYLAGILGGYLGLVRLEDGRLDLAAAFDPRRLRSFGGPSAVAGTILKEVGWPTEDGLADLAWRGTPPLTRMPARLAEERLFVLGDAAGYVEPFTGEGIAWAAASAVAVAPLAAEAVRSWQPRMIEDWTRRYRNCLARRQRTCRLIARGLRHPLLVRMILNLLARWPGLANPLVQRLNSPPTYLEGFAS